MTTRSNRSVVLAHQPTDRFVLPFSFNSLACLLNLLSILTSAFANFVVKLSALLERGQRPLVTIGSLNPLATNHAASLAKCHNKVNLNAPKLMQVKDLTVEVPKSLIQETVTETIESLLNDLDESKQIKAEVQQQLLRSLQKSQSGERGIPAEEIAKNLGLT
jgi:hypothetical protein